MAAFFDVRPDERRPLVSAFLALLGIMVAHTLIETARDALFLTRIPVRRLPALYLALAALGLVSARAARMLERRREKAGTTSRVDPLTATLVIGAAVSGAFWLLTALSSQAVLYGLYLWSGLFTAWVAGQLWSRLASVFTVAQAKRLYGPLGTGAVLGAVVGAAIARACLSWTETRNLVLLGAIVLLVTAFGPTKLLGRQRELTARAAPSTPRRDADGENMNEVLKDPYLVRVVGIALLTASAGTAIDFVFKSEVARAVPDPQALARLLATTYLATNALSLVVQAFGVSIAMRVLGVHRALYVLPVLVVGGASIGMLGLGVWAALALRGIDGTFRQSLQKTCSELLLVPLPDVIRARAKPIVDLLGQRGGQALTSILIFGIAEIGTHRVGNRIVTQLIAGVILVIALGWIALTFSLRDRYLDVFRATLRRGRIELGPEMPDLDISALEVLISSLNSRRDAQVLGALELLAAQSRGQLIPSLVLFHPSKDVVLRSLELLVATGRSDFVPVADRLLGHADVEVRTAALRARAAVDGDPEVLRDLLDDDDEGVRATALVALLAGGAIDADDAAYHALVRGSVEVRRALARALGHVRVDADRWPVIERTLLALANDEDRTIRELTADAMGHHKQPGFVPVLLRMLDDGPVGLRAIAALAELGDASIPAASAALDADDVVDETKWRLLRVLGHIGSPAAVTCLLARIGASGSPMELRALRALRTVQTAGVKVPIDDRKVRALAMATIDGIARALAFRLAQASLAERHAARKTIGASLLAKLLVDTQTVATDRLFLLLGLLHPGERVARIQRGLASRNPRTRASSIELLQNLLAEPLRDRVLAVVDDLEDGVRLARLGGARPDESYVELLGAMLAERGALGDLAAYHAAELGMREAASVAAQRIGEDTVPMEGSVSWSAVPIAVAAIEPT